MGCNKSVCHIEVREYLVRRFVGETIGTVHLDYFLYLLIVYFPYGLITSFAVVYHVILLVVLIFILVLSCD